MNEIEIYKDVWAALQRRRERLPHAMLISGQKGLGKSALATSFAASLLCEQPKKDGVACGVCLPCNWFAQGNHPDFRLLQPEAFAEDAPSEEGKKKPSQQITIDQIRALDEFLNVGTHRGGLRIILVNPAEAMNRSTANSLLKSLEEPASDTLFLLVSNESIRLLPTIRSRCQVVPVSVPDQALAEKALMADGISDAGRWLALAGGSPKFAAELARGGPGSWLDSLTQLLASGKRIDPLGAAASVDKLLRDGKGKILLKQVIEVIQKWLVDLNLAKSGVPVRYFLPQESTISGLADMIPAVRLIQAYRNTIPNRLEAEQPLNARLFLEGLFLDYGGLFAK